MQCENCKNDISSEANYCPKCGHPNNIQYCLSVRSQYLSLIIAAAILLLAIIVTEKYLDNEEFDIYQQIAADAAEEYKTISQSGDHAKKCLHARIIAAAYLKADDKTSYQNWKLIGQSECVQ